MQANIGELSYPRKPKRTAERRQMPDMPEVTLPPPLQAIAEASRKQPGLADMTVEECRAFIAARTAARARGPVVDAVLDLSIPGPGGIIASRLYRPMNASGSAVVFHG